MIDGNGVLRPEINAISPDVLEKIGTLVVGSNIFLVGGDFEIPSGNEVVTSDAPFLLAIKGLARVLNPNPEVSVSLFSNQETFLASVRALNGTDHSQIKSLEMDVLDNDESQIGVERFINEEGLFIRANHDSLAVARFQTFEPTKEQAGPIDLKDILALFDIGQYLQKEGYSSLTVDKFIKKLTGSSLSSDIYPNLALSKKALLDAFSPEGSRRLSNMDGRNFSIMLSVVRHFCSDPDQEATLKD